MVEVCHSSLLKTLTTFAEQPKIKAGGKMSDVEAVATIIKVKDLKPEYLDAVLVGS